MLPENEFKSSFARAAEAARHIRLDAEASNREAFDETFGTCIARIKAADDVLDSMGRPGSIKYGNVIVSAADASISIEFFTKRSDGFEIEFQYRPTSKRVGQIRVYDRHRSYDNFSVEMSDDDKLIVAGEGLVEFVENLLKELLVDTF